MPGKALLGEPKIPTGEVQEAALSPLRTPSDIGETCYTAYNEIPAPIAEVVRPIQAYTVARTLSLRSYAVIALGNASIAPDLPF